MAGPCSIPFKISGIFVHVALLVFILEAIALHPSQAKKRQKCCLGSVVPFLSSINLVYNLCQQIYEPS